LVILTILLIGIGYYFWPRGIISPKGLDREMIDLKLEKYDFDSLRKRAAIKAARTLDQENVGAGLVPALNNEYKIEILGVVDGVEKRRVSKYDFVTREISFESDGKKISGMMNMPKDGQPQGIAHTPIIIMIRGYAEPAGYYVGSGTWRVADELAKAGYTTISLDFLGYGNSDNESTDVLEARFQKVNQVMDLIESVKNLPWVDRDRIGVWAHSNGGQIALSVLEVTGRKYPTVLWAPMTNPFPQSLIDTADEGEEKQKAIDFVNLFLKHYDGRRYAFENYYDWIKAPVLIQQGTNDAWCKVDWQKKVALAINGELVVYEGADHNMLGSWAEAVARAEEFYKKSGF